MSDRNDTKRFRDACSSDDRETILSLLKNGFSPNPKDSIFQEIAAKGYAETLRVVLPLFDPKTGGSFALQEAAKNGHPECVEILIPISNPSSDGSLALQLSAQYGHAECVRLLIPHSDIKEFDLALLWSAENGHAECVSLFLDSGAIDRRSQIKAAGQAAIFGHGDVLHAFAENVSYEEIMGYIVEDHPERARIETLVATVWQTSKHLPPSGSQRRKKSL